MTLFTNFLTFPIFASVSLTASESLSVLSLLTSYIYDKSFLCTSQADMSVKLNSKRDIPISGEACLLYFQQKIVLHEAKLEEGGIDNLGAIATILRQIRDEAVTSQRYNML